MGNVLKAFRELFLGCLILAVACTAASAFPPPVPVPLTMTIQNADVIVLARLNTYTPDAISGGDIATLSGPEQVQAETALKTPGNYTFTVVYVVKGSCPRDLQIHLPYVSGSSYDNAILDVDEGTYVLLFLADGGDVLRVMDPHLPLIDLGSDWQKDFSTVHSVSSDSTQEVVQLILASLGNQAVTLANTYLLRQVVDSRIPPSLSHLLTTQNDGILDNVLYCLATNQDVGAIPRIADLELKLSKQESGAESVIALEGYRVRRAVPYLNALLACPNVFVRETAILSLRKIADSSSVPYLILALSDPDPQHMIPYQAYATLHRLVPLLGTTQDVDYFRQNQVALTEAVIQWWKTYLSGKEKWELSQDAASNDGVTGRTPDATGDTLLPPLPIAYSDLFSTNINDRLKMVQEIRTANSAASIPSLIVALHDPDEDIAYTAYQTLYTLIPRLGGAQDRTDFIAGEGKNRIKETGPIYDWWHKYLESGDISQFATLGK